MKTLQRFRTTFLVALSAGLPLFIPVFPGLPWWAKLLILVTVVGVVALREYIQSVKPHLDFEKKRNYFFDLACAGALEGLREFDETARLNVMEIDWRLPRKKWGRFKPVYQINMEGARDLYLGLRVDQGAAGEAAYRRTPYVANLEAPDAPSFRLDENQQEKTKELTLIFSWPVMQLKKMDDGEFYPQDEVIGVLNIDSRKKGALAFYEETVFDEEEDTSLREELEEVLDEMSLTCSWIMS